MQVVAADSSPSVRSGVALVGRSVPWRSLAIAVPLAAGMSLFAVANFFYWRRTGEPTGLGATLLELTCASFLVVRRPARSTSRSPLAWAATVLGTFGCLAARPGGQPLGGLDPLYAGLQLTGLAVALASILTLRRSFGLVAANRGVCSSGPYRLVRHPLYLGYFLTQLGYGLESPTDRNWAILAAVGALQLLRIRAEERCLNGDPAYAAYCERVRWRLLPQVV